MIPAFQEVFIVGCLSLLSCPCFGTDVHVALTGSDKSSGTAGQPWRTIQHAISSSNAGDRIFVHAGVYRESLTFERSGNDTDGPIVLTNFQKDKVVLDGSNTPNDDIIPMIEIRSQSNLTLSGLEICNLKTDKLDETPIAIFISGDCNKITIENCKIYDIANLAKPNSELNGRDAHGIAVYGDDASPITELRITGNVLRDLTLGSSEALVVNGNVDGFEIKRNVIHDCDNIGIDCIGFEDVSPNGKTDQARNGVVAENRVFNIGTSTNPSYQGERSAAGIYVDGGRDILVERNLVHHCDFGIEIASEKKGKVTQNISVGSNILHHNTNSGLIIGGYNEDSTGDAKDCLISNNTFFNNDTEVDGDEWGQIHLQHRVEDCTFANNILVHDIAKNGCNLFVVQWPKSSKNIIFRHNQYFGSSTPVWVFKDEWIEGWDDYQKCDLPKQNESFANPMLDAPKTGKFELQAGSPAIDSGDSSIVSKKQTDFEGQQRIFGNAVDRGAIEFNVPPKQNRK